MNGVIMTDRCEGCGKIIWRWQQEVQVCKGTEWSKPWHKKCANSDNESERQEKESEAVDYGARKIALFNLAPDTEPLDSFHHNEAVAYYYWMHQRLHGFIMSYEIARRRYETDKHILAETEEYAKRLPQKEAHTLTRAEIMSDLFQQWTPFGYCPFGKPAKSFEHDGLIGARELIGGPGWIGGNFDVVIKDGETTVLHIRNEIRAKSRSYTYDEAYSDRLDAYIDALRKAIQERDENIEATRMLEETRF